MSQTPIRKVHKDGKKRLLDGINELATTVASTLGAAGKTVILENPHTGLPYVTKDGVTVAEYVNPLHPVENLGASLIREASKKTAAEAGDGTTTSTVLAKAILEEAIPACEDKSFRKVIEEIKADKDAILAAIDAKSTPVTEENLKHIASISANNDRVIGELIAEAYEMVGIEGSVIVADSDTPDTHIVLNEGSTLSRGYESSHFANQQDGTCVLESPKVLICDQKIDSVWKIENVLEGALKGGNSLLIIGDLDVQAISTLAINAKKGFKVCVIKPPLHGHMKTTILEDLALLTGGNVIGEEYGTSLTTAAYNDLGEAKQVIISAHDTIFQFNETSEEVDNHIKALQSDRDTADVNTIGLIKYRLNLLTGKLATVKVGAVTETALKELKDRVDDAVHATKCALQEGVLPGGGVALKDIASKLDNGIMARAIKAPFIQILDNAGYEGHKYYLPEGEGIDVLTGEYVNVLKSGIVDPTKVTKQAIINAVDVACTVLGTDFIVTNLRSDELNGN